MVRLYPFSEEARELWKTYPVRVLGPAIASCHNAPTFLVQSMKGGFVTQNCSECGARLPLSNDAFLDHLAIWVGCPECKQRMTKEIVNRNYAFLCGACDIAVDLASLLPFYDEITS